MMMFLLVSALALATTTLIQQRGSLALGDSVKAFQLANDGFEDIIASYKHNPVAEIQDLDKSSNCSDGVVTNTTIAPSSYQATFFREGQATPLPCDTPISEVSEVKIVATIGSSTRAIETAFAAGSSAFRFDSASQAITTGASGEVINFGNSPDLNAVGFSDSSTGTLTVTKPGVYFLNAQATVDGVLLNKQAGIKIKEGTTVKASDVHVNTGSFSDPIMHASTVIALSVGDTIQVNVWHDNGSSKNALDVVFSGFLLN